MKKIMFNDRFGLTGLVLSGRKTVTRRVIPEIEIHWNRRGMVTMPVSGFMDGTLFMDCKEFLPDSGRFDYAAPRRYQPLYDIGEVVAVSQSYRDVYDEYLNDIDNPIYVAFANAKDEDLSDVGFGNKMFVSADLMPHRIEITNLWAERLQDIEEEQAIKEGIQTDTKHFTIYRGQHGFYDCKLQRPRLYHSPRLAFAGLIDLVSGRGTWQRNPWDYVYEFKQIR